MLTIISILPAVQKWPIQVSIIMIICNLIAIIIGRYAIQVRGLGPSIPLPSLRGFGLAELIATTSLGHIIGAGTIIGLSNLNLI
uniref:Photosystem I reaction center subunit PsaK n=1 Tax=Neogoniolithon spectabile TaxID=231755 RepID=A0A3G3MH05_9FLOR|nr:photosystem I subunit X [Neogoniolithon spectabile]AYR06114.1 photosystem I subunit X [Neogoniolithon spectabile]